MSGFDSTLVQKLLLLIVACLYYNLLFESKFCNLLKIKFGNILKERNFMMVLNFVAFAIVSLNMFLFLGKKCFKMPSSASHK